MKEEACAVFGTLFVGFGGLGALCLLGIMLHRLNAVEVAMLLGSVASILLGVLLVKCSVDY